MPVQRHHRTALAAILASFLLLAGLVVAAPADAATAADEQRFIQLINQTRAGAGLPPLSVHPELRSQARAWSTSMASSDQLAHSPNVARGISAPWTVLGENVGVHGVNDVGQLHAAFVASPSHYQNIIDPRYTHVGVGVVVTEGGKLWTTHRFMATAEPTPTTQAPTTQPPTTKAPTTQPPTTRAPTTRPPTTRAATTRPPTTKPPTTRTPASQAKNTQSSTTQAPAAEPAAIQAPTPTASSSTAPSTAAPSTAAIQPAGTTPSAGDTAVPSASDGTVDRVDRVDSDVAEPVSAGPGRPDLDSVEQLLIDLIEAGI